MGNVWGGLIYNLNVETAADRIYENKNKPSGLQAKLLFALPRNYRVWYL